MTISSFNSRHTINIVTWPSWVWKDTLLKSAYTLGWQKLVAYTNRPPRTLQWERDGYDYYFVDKDQYTELQTMEWGMIHEFNPSWTDIFYGLHVQEVVQKLKKNTQLRLQSNLEAALQMPWLIQSKTWYIVPSQVFWLQADEKTLSARLEKRNSESPAAIATRMEQNAYYARILADIISSHTDGSGMKKTKDQEAACSVFIIDTSLRIASEVRHTVQWILQGGPLVEEPWIYERYARDIVEDAYTAFLTKWF